MEIALLRRGFARAFGNVKRSFEPGRRLQDRIIQLFVALLMAVQLATLVGMRVAIEETASRTLRDELEVGAKVFDRLLLTQGRQLEEAGKVLSADFGFREAVATRDQKTIVSALENHAARFKASRMSLVGLDGRIIADSVQPGETGKRFAAMELMSRETGVERGSSIRLFAGKPYQVVVVPVRTPMTIGWVAMMQAIDDATARDLERLVNAGVAFVVVDGHSTPQVVATTLGKASRQALDAQLPDLVGARHNGHLETPGTKYQTLSRLVDEFGSQRIYAVLMRATEEAMAPFRVLEITSLLLAAAALLLTLGGAIRIARQVARPVTKAAREITAHRDAIQHRLRSVRTQRDDLALISRDLVAQLNRDSLTGLGDRRAAELQMAAWWAQRRPYAVLMIDIDQFRLLNQSFTHEVGNSVLEGLGNLLEDMRRSNDFLARYGGEEFILVIPDPQPNAAVTVAERIRSRIAGHQWQTIMKGLYVTVSVGVAEARKGGDPADAVKRAEAALRDAKAAGRNQVRNHA
jgi:diguanylate cyclase (GGDEF)-like protein